MTTHQGEHCGRSPQPIIKVDDLAWLEFEKPDLVRAEAFAQAFGFAVTLQTPRELHLRGADTNSPCVIIRSGERNRFCGMAFRTVDTFDLARLASATDRRITPLPDSVGGCGVDLLDPSGLAVRVVTGMHTLEALPLGPPSKALPAVRRSSQWTVSPCCPR